MVEHKGRPHSGHAGEEPAIRLKFWGTRGSIPCSGAPYLKYGGNTACVELRCGEHIFVLDAGSGIREFGETLINDPPGRIDILLTHYHFDHVCGLPFFTPMHLPTARPHVWACNFEDDTTTEAAISSFMKPPLFPVTPLMFQADVEYHDVVIGDTLRPVDDVTIETAPLHHPQGATGYRINHRGASVCYLTDTEAGPGGLDPNLAKFAHATDILIVDGMFTDEELDACSDWGHGSWRQAVALADAADAGTLVLFHHHPRHNDAVMDAISSEAAELRPGTIVARDHLVLSA